MATLKDDRQVVHFTIAINDFYKPKGSREGKQLTTFVNCAYWISPKIAELLIKGVLFEVPGSLYATVYMTGNKEARASLNFHVNTIKAHVKTLGAKQEEVNEQETDTEKMISRYNC